MATAEWAATSKSSILDLGTQFATTNGTIMTPGITHFLLSNLYVMASDRVVCRAMGFSDGKAVCCARFGYSTTERILLDNVRCMGSESNLAQCAHNGVFNENCSHSEDAGVVCY
jgi:hypothetical protein